MKIKLGLGKMSISAAAGYCHGDLYDFTEDPDAGFSYICTDSREADGETLFVAIRGERVDGHDYIINAMEAGCRYFLCEYVPDSFAGKQAAAIMVENSVSAFCDIAAGYRSGNILRSVAVTGSVGKTTTKEFISAVLSESFRIYRTEGNHNSVIGMPMSLMEAEADCKAAVFEMGMSGFGEISAMSCTAAPEVAVITNIGTSHLEYLKTRENIARAKMEITEGLREGGRLILNGDEPLLEGKYSDKYQTVYVSLTREDRDVYAKNIRCTDKETVFDLVYFGEEYDGVVIPAPGKHLVYAALYAICAGRAFGMDFDDIFRGVRAFVPVGMRQNIEKVGEVTVISDCYNAAPESMRAALDLQAELARLHGGRCVAVLGDMRELGDDTVNLHREVGRYAYGKGVGLLICVGKLGKNIADGAVCAGMDPYKVLCFEDPDATKEIASVLSEKTQSRDIILFKASRALSEERIITEFKNLRV